MNEVLALLAEASRRELPRNARLALVHAVALHDSGCPDDALRELEQPVRVNPDDAALVAAERLPAQGRSGHTETK
jgi:hypothetical protein